MNNKDVFNPQISEDITEFQLDKYINLIIYSYNKIINKKRGILHEDIRRNMLVNVMRKNKFKFKINDIIASYETFGDDYTTIGRTDITFFVNVFENRSFTIECKRFLENEINKSQIQNQYIGNGVNRFITNKYPTYWGYAGMMSFVESGDILKLSQILNKQFKMTNLSQKYKYQFITESSEYSSAKKLFKIVHILLNFA